MSGAFVFERPVRFEDIDAAGIVFFPRYLEYTHEAMERFFDGLPTRPGGVAPGYVDLITKRRIGFPAVHVTADYKGPLRYGDVAVIATTVARIGKTSITFRYEITRKADAVHVATIEHVVVASDLDTVTKRDLPEDVLSLLLERTGA